MTCSAEPDGRATAPATARAAAPAAAARAAVLREAGMESFPSGREQPGQRGDPRQKGDQLSEQRERLPTNPPGAPGAVPVVKITLWFRDPLRGNVIPEP
ncbi:hypothetical protein GCM10009527_015780 [Actinomadura nitritigenes]